jgi:hypothetical protein
MRLTRLVSRQLNLVDTITEDLQLPTAIGFSTLGASLY